MREKSWEDRVGRRLVEVECSMECSECKNKGLLKMVISPKRPFALVCPYCERVHDSEGNPSFTKGYDEGVEFPEYFGFIVKGETYRII